MDETSVNPDEGNDGPLSLAEAASAYARPVEEQEAPEGHAEAETVAEDDVEDQDDLETDETDEEGHAEDEEEAEPEPVAAYAPETAKVKLPDGEEVTVSDLIKGNLRDRDYRQKTEAVAQERKAFAAKSEEVKQFEQQLAADRDFVIELIQSVMPQKPDPAMASVDPVGYVNAKAEYDARKEQMDYLVSVKQHLAQKNGKEQAETQKEVQAREWKATLEAMPELKDSTKLNGFVQDVQKFGTEAFGFTNTELQNLAYDHRQAVVLRDAIAWRKLQARKSKAPAKVEGRPPVQRGGTRQSPQTQAARDARDAMARLRSSGSLRDGVAALLATEKG